MGLLSCLGLVSCMSVGVESVRDMTLSAPPFNVALHREYLALADGEGAHGDWRARSFFAWKARAAGRGDVVAPERLEDWALPPLVTDALAASRARLLVALAEARRARLADLAAVAQTRFDCWVEASEWDRGEESARRCERAFELALRELESVLDR